MAREKIRRVLIPLFVVVWCGMMQGCAAAPEEVAYDVLIRGGRVFDGNAAEALTADVAVRGDRIVAVGDLRGRARKTLEAAGLAVTPGWIDLYSHEDERWLEAGRWQRVLAVVRPPRDAGDRRVSEGVTTVVTGVAGRGATDVKAWLRFVDRGHFAINVAHLLPYGALRRELAGDGTGRLSPEQRSRMQTRLNEALLKGAVGVSLGPDQVPDALASPEEWVEIADTVKRHRALVVSRLRDYRGQRTGPDDPGLTEAIAELLQWERKTGAALHVSQVHIEAPYGPSGIGQIVEILRRAGREGRKVTLDYHPGDGEPLPLSHRLPLALRAAGVVRREYRTGAGRVKLDQAVNDLLNVLPPEKILLVVDRENKTHEGKTLREVADGERQPPAALFSALVCRERPPLALFLDNPDSLKRRLAKLRTACPAAGDGSEDGECDGPLPGVCGALLWSLRKDVLQDQVVTFAERVRSQTALPAEILGLEKRGRIAEGYYADVVLWDLKKIALSATRRGHGEVPPGPKAVLVNGVLSVDEGSVTAKRGGRALRKSATGGL